MIYYFLKLVIGGFIIIYSITKMRLKNRVLAFLSISIGGLISVHSIIQFIKIYLFKNNLNAFYQIIAVLENYNKIENIIMYILCGVIIVYMLIKLYKIKDKTDDNLLSFSIDLRKFLRYSVLLIIVLGLLIVSANYANYEDKGDEVIYIDFEDVTFDNLSGKELDNLTLTLDTIYERNNDFFVKETFNNIGFSKNLSFINRESVTIQSVLDGNDFYDKYLDKFKPYKEGDFSQTVRDWLVCYEKGEYQVYELEYTYAKGKNLYICYTIIMYGTTINNEPVVCVHNVLDKHTLSLSIFNINNKVREHQYYFDILEFD